jgi:transcriptional regulator with XRE-family HTH domain
MTKTGVFKMFNLYNTIKELCDSRGISVSKMSSDIGIHRNVMPRLKASDGKKTLSLQTLEKLSAYFDVPITYFIDEKDADRHGPPQQQTPTITDDDLMFALFGEVSGELTEEDLEDVKKYAAFVKQRKLNMNKED